MIKQLKKFTIQLIAGANLAIVVLMLLVGFSDRIDPEQHPLLACAGMTFPIFLLANLLMLCFWTLFAWRKLWIPVAGFILAYVPINIYMPVRAMESPPDDALKLVSYNVCGYGSTITQGDHFDSIFSYLRHQQADIICLQEDNDTWRSADDRFAEHFAHNERVRICSDETKLSNHIGLHTRFPILRSERIDLTSSACFNGAAAFYLQVGTDTMLVVGCHLENIHLDKKDREQYKEILKGNIKGDTAKTESKYLLGKFSDAMKIRAAQAKAIRQYIGEHRGNGAVIVCGDFNDTPISFARHTISEGLTDCFAASGRGLGLSYNQKGFNFRIDYILCSEDLTPYYCLVDSKIEESDHYPVICWLKMGHKP